jgi:hypothetical protein
LIFDRIVAASSATQAGFSNLKDMYLAATTPGQEALDWYASKYVETGEFKYKLGVWTAALWTPETAWKTTLILGGASRIRTYPNAKGFGLDLGVARIDLHMVRVGGKKTGFDILAPHIDSKLFHLKHWPIKAIDKIIRGVK